MSASLQENLPLIWTLEISLLSDTALGRGEGVAGLVDSEVDHDESGLPYLHGRRIKGLLSAQCAEILAALRLQGKNLNGWDQVADNIFGKTGLNEETIAHVSFGHGKLPSLIYADLALSSKEFPRLAVLGALTTIRRQTKVDSTSGTARDKSLRATRAIRRNLTFTSEIVFMGQSDQKMVGLLAACAASLRHIGMRRWRGMGLVKTRLFSDAYPNPLALFELEAR